MTTLNNKLSKNARWAVLTVGVILLFINLFMVDYEQVWSRENLGPGLSILANGFIIAAMGTSLKHTRKKNGE